MESEIHDERVWDKKNIIMAFIIGIFAIIIQFSVVAYFNLGLLYSAIIAIVLIICYAIILFFLIEPRVIREIRVNPSEKEIERIVEKEIVEPTIKEVENIVEKPVYYEVPRPVPVYREVRTPIFHKETIERPVYKSFVVGGKKEKEKLEIPKYDYIGSSLTKTYHLKTCRIGKSIKRKYAENRNDVGYFLTKKYSPCKLCKPDKKKIEVKKTPKKKKVVKKVNSKKSKSINKKK